MLEVYIEFETNKSTLFKGLFYCLNEKISKMMTLQHIFCFQFTTSCEILNPCTLNFSNYHHIISYRL